MNHNNPYKDGIDGSYMRIVKSEDKIKDGEEFLSLTGGKKCICLDYKVFEGTVLGRGSDMGGPHRKNTTYAEERFEAEHPLTPGIYSEDKKGKYSFSEIRNMEFVLHASRKRTYANSVLDKIHPCDEKFPIIDSFERREALKRIKDMAIERIGEYVENTHINTIYIGADSKRSEAFLESLISKIKMASGGFDYSRFAFSNI